MIEWIPQPDGSLLPDPPITHVWIGDERYAVKDYRFIPGGASSWGKTGSTPLDDLRKVLACPIAHQSGRESNLTPGNQTMGEGAEMKISIDLTQDEFAKLKSEL